MIIRTDVFIVGAGGAALRAGCELVKGGVEICIVSNGSAATLEVMGFNAVIDPRDSAACYAEDILAAGCGINRPPLAETLAENAGNQISFLESMGLEFDRTDRGDGYHTLSTLGSSYPRLVHHGALTGGRELLLMKKFCRDNGAVFLEGINIIEIIKKDGCAVGAIGIDLKSGEIVQFLARAVLVAAGGSGALYPVSTYPQNCVGEGYALGALAGAELVDMEFQQFEPCSFVFPEQLKGKIVPTTLMRLGARLLNGQGEEFLEHYGLTPSNARKGLLSRAIASEIKQGRGTAHGGIFYDMTMLPEKVLTEGHSIFYKPAKAAGMDICHVPAEMAPAAHTMLGGIKIDIRCQSTVPGLFSAGESAGGIHGADRIGGCAGAEILVFGEQAGRGILHYLKSHREPGDSDIGNFREKNQELIKRTKEFTVPGWYKRIREIMGACMGIIRCEEEMKTAAETLSLIRGEMEKGENGAETPADYYRCRNMLITAGMQVEASRYRKESRGVFYREDYPVQDDTNWRKSMSVVLKNGIPCIKDE